MSVPNDPSLGPDDPRRLGGYELVGRLRENGHGVVYLGQTDSDTKVAVTLVRGGARARLATEAEAARQVTGRHVARVLAADVSEDRLYVVSEFVEGPSLRRAIEDEGPLRGVQLHKIAMRTAGGLASIHRAGIVHREFTPGSVLLGPDGPKVIDFAITPEAAPPPSGPTGTPAYLAPEQIEDEPVGPPTDVFAWGATIVYAATGRPPFGTGPRPAVMRGVTSRPPDLGDLESPLRDLVARSLDKNPAARPTAAQLARALRDGRLPAPKARPRRIPRYRWRMMVALFAVVALGFVVGVLLPGTV